MYFTGGYCTFIFVLGTTILKGYSCSFVAKLSRKKKLKKNKIFVFFTKYILFAVKKSFYRKKKLKQKKNYYFFQKKTFYTENICVTNKNMYLFELYNHSAKKKN